MTMIEGKRIVLGITGSIAAYKACLIIRALIKRKAEVQVVITPSGKEFITPLTLSTLTGKPVVSEFFDRRDGSWYSHVAMGEWADAMLIAPCTASSLAKMATGVADNMLITTYLSMKAPVFIAPAMDLDMYRHPSTQHNIETLRSYGNHIIEPQTGFLASGLEGKGRMEEPEEIVKTLEAYFMSGSLAFENSETQHNGEQATKTEGSLEGKKIMITAGPTYEKLDPVRFIGNYSSGKMGFALAEECANRGADVVLISGPVGLSTTHNNIHRIDVESAEEMHNEAVKAFGDSHAAILCAAVADFRPANVSDTKIKRGKEELVLHLEPTCDIASELGKMKKEHQCLIGFALETNDVEENAHKKLKKKNFDFIVLNSISKEHTPFRSDTNKITIIDEQCEKCFPLKTKREVAADIVDNLVEKLLQA